MNLCIHYGFGDYVMCYGMVRELAKSQDINLFAIPHKSPLHLDNIVRLYSSIKNVQIINDLPKEYKNVVYVGYKGFFSKIRNGIRVQNQEYFYSQMGVNLNLLWDNFYFERNIKKEKEVFYDILGLNDREEYIVLHDDPSRGFVINRKYLGDFKIIHIRKFPEISLLDVLYLIEKCKQFHVINTGLASFVDQMKIQHPNMNFHRYCRPAFFENPILKMKWNIIN